MSQASMYKRMVLVAVLLAALTSAAAHAQAPAGTRPVTGAAPVGLTEFVIGPEDVLTIVFWRDKDMSGDVTVRPDGVITLPLLGEIRAAGLSPSALTAEIQGSAGRYLTDPNVTVVVRQINSRKVYITGEVTKGGAFPLTGSLTVMQLIALAGGVLEYAKVNEITVLREEEGRTRAHRFSYEDVSRGQKLEQNFELRPGDTIVVP